MVKCENGFELFLECHVISIANMKLYVCILIGFLHFRKASSFGVYEYGIIILRNYLVTNKKKIKLPSTSATLDTSGNRCSVRLAK